MNENGKLNNSTFIRQLMFMLSLIAIGLVIFFKLHYLLSSFLGAITLYIVLRNPTFKLIEKRHWRPWLASLLFCFLAVVALVGLGFLIFEIIASRIPTSINLDAILPKFIDLTTQFNNFIGVNLISKDFIMSFKGVISSFASGILNSTYNFAINLIMMIFILYFMLANGRKFECTVLKYTPFKGKSIELIKEEVKNMIYSNAIGIPIIMIAQSLVAGLGYWIAGFEHVVFLAFITAFCGLIPVVGTGLIWLPSTIYLFVTGDIWQGIFLLIYSVVILTNTDNACRLVLMKIMADTHPLIVILGVLLGIPLFGFWGIIFGPLLISGFLLLIKIYYMEYHEVDCKPSFQKREKKNKEIIEE